MKRRPGSGDWDSLGVGAGLADGADEPRRVRTAAAAPLIVERQRQTAGTKRRLARDAMSSYACRVERRGSLTLGAASRLCGISDRTWTMVLSRAARLSSLGTVYHGAAAVSVACSRDLVRGSSRTSARATGDAGIDDEALDDRAQGEEARVLLLGAEAHHVFDARAVVPAAVEYHDLARGREVLDVALKMEL